ncbi:MAG: ribosome small subunit-dependent GTPase A [Clostridia bacterium]|nr:ribosome small subunit-dependent GTPase A [Clostridia bacterium]
MGMIIKVNSGIYTVKCGDEILECRPLGKMRRGQFTPIAGDNCIVEKTEQGKGLITEILPRKNSLIRPKLANIDNLLVCFAAANPSPLLNVIDKLTVLAEKNNIKPIIIITKADIGADEEIEKYRSIYEKAGYKVIITSVNDKDALKRELREELSNKITAVAGCSGVGKSTLLNNFLGEDFLVTGEISAKNKRGKNTTTGVELFPCCDGYIADTPGFSSLEIYDTEKEELETLFPEIKRHIGFCRFVGCSHISEPDCPVKEAVYKGEISMERYNSYTEFYNKIKNTKKY